MMNGSRMQGSRAVPASHAKSDSARPPLSGVKESAEELRKKEALEAMDTSELPKNGAEQEDGEVSDESSACVSAQQAPDDDGEIVEEEEPKERPTRRNNPPVVKAEEDPEVAKKSALEKLKNMKFNAKSKFTVGSPSRERREREKKERQTAASDEEDSKRVKYSMFGGPSSLRIGSPHRENDDERRMRKRRWDDHNEDDRPSVRLMERPRPLRDAISPVPCRPVEPARPVDQPSTLRQRVERMIGITEAEVASLGDTELRSFLVKLLELDREQQRLYNGRRAQLEALHEMHKQVKEDVERLMMCIPLRLRGDLPPLPGHIITGRLDQPPAGVPVNGVSGAGGSIVPSAQLGFGGMNIPPPQGPQEFGPPTSQSPSSASTASTFPVAPSLLNRAPAFGIGGPSASPQPPVPPFLNVPPPSGAPGCGPSAQFVAPIGSMPPGSYSRPPPSEGLSASSVLPNLNQPPPALSSSGSGAIPPLNFSMPPPSSSAASSTPSSATQSVSSTSVSSNSSSTAQQNFSTTLSTSPGVNSPAVSARSSPPPQGNLPSVNLSVPPPIFNLPPPRNGASGPASFSGPPPPVGVSTHPSRGTLPVGPIPSLLSGPPPSIPLGRTPPLNIPGGPMSSSGPPNLSCPPPSMNCPPPSIRPPVNVSNPHGVHQMASTAASQSGSGSQPAAEGVSDLPPAKGYTRSGGGTTGNSSSSASHSSRMGPTSMSLTSSVPGPPPSGGAHSLMSSSKKLPSHNLSSSSSRLSNPGGAFRNFNNQSSSGRYGGRGQPRRQISDMVAIIPDEHDIPESSDNQDDSNIFLIVSDEEDSGK